MHWPSDCANAGAASSAAAAMERSLAFIGPA
jgi:hypothetical protein